MRTFAKKPKANQQTTSTKPFKPSRSFVGQSRDVQSILHLQHTIGNRTVLKLLQTAAENVDASLASSASTNFAHDFSQIPIKTTTLSNIQPKLKVNALRDRYEQEADRIADEVLRRKIPDIQKACTDCDEEESLQRKPDSNRRIEPNLENRLTSTKGSGSPLPKITRVRMENDFGADFSRVRIHTGQEATQLNQKLGALAFTHGNDIYFNQGKYDTNSSSGNHLLAHELTHTLQQGAATPSVIGKKKQLNHTKEYLIQKQISVVGQDVLVPSMLAPFNRDISYLQSFPTLRDEPFILRTNPQFASLIYQAMLNSSERFIFESEAALVRNLSLRTVRIVELINAIDSGQCSMPSCEVLLEDPQFTISFIEGESRLLRFTEHPLVTTLSMVASELPDYTNFWTDIGPEYRIVYVMGRLIGNHRFSTNSAAALVGNLMIESALLPNRVERSSTGTPMRSVNRQGRVQDFTTEEIMNRSPRSGPQYGGVGIAQWSTTRTSDRRSELFQFRQIGAAILYDMDAQVDFMVHEIQNNFDFRDLNGVLSRSGVSIQEASDKILSDYFRPEAIIDRTTSPPRIRTRAEAAAIYDIRLRSSNEALDAYRRLTGARLGE